MTENQLNILKEALLEAEQNEIVFYDSLPNEDFAFSCKYKKFIGKMLHNNKIIHNNKCLRNRLIIPIVAVLMTFILMISISAIRVPVIKFIINLYEDFVSIFVDESDDITSCDTIEEVYLPSSMPYDFIDMKTENYGVLVITTWINNNNSTIQLYQHILVEGVKAFIDKQEINYTQKNLNSNLIIFYANKNNVYNIVWTDEKYIYNILCPNNLEFFEIEKIIESM